MKKHILLLILVLFQNAFVQAESDIYIYVILPKNYDFDLLIKNSQGLLNFVSKLSTCEQGNEIEEFEMKGLCNGLNTAICITELNVSLKIPINYLFLLTDAKNKSINILPFCSTFSTERDIETRSYKNFCYRTHANVIDKFSEVNSKSQLLQIKMSEREFEKALLKANNARLKEKRKEKVLLVKNHREIYKYLLGSSESIKIQVKVDYKIIEGFQYD